MSEEKTLLQMIEELQTRMDDFCTRLDAKESSRVFSALGSKTSEAKAAAARANGAKSKGRPRKSD
jgi:hypothetical protein